MSFEYKESYMHKAAKHVLYTWVQEHGLLWYREGLEVFKEIAIRERDSPELYTGIHDLCPQGRPKSQILVVPDLLVFYKGSTEAIVEITHTNPVTERKRNTLIDLFPADSIGGPDIIELDAEWILKQIRLPKTVQFTNLRTGRASYRKIRKQN